MAEETTFRVKRYRPEVSDEPFFEEFAVPSAEDTMVLDGLSHIKGKLDGSLTFRFSCGMGICGSCGTMVNGVPRLTCSTFVRELKGKVVRVEPLDHFPVIKDLVVEFDDFLEKLVSVTPWLVRNDERPVEEGEYLQTPAQVERYRQQSLCINCMLCYSACPVYGLSDGFLGPAVIALASRYIADSRDQGGEERLAKLVGHEGIWECSFVGECSVVCPKHVDPSWSIQQLKFPGAMQVLKAMFRPRR